MGISEIPGKIALVTGASRGIGKAIALALARAGADVAVNFQKKEAEAHEVCRLINAMGRRSLAVRADVSLAEEVARLTGAVEKELGPISILVNNAGIAKPRGLGEVTEELWDETIRINLKSCFLVTEAVWPGMRERKWGRIINISSTAAQVGGVVGPHYAASKAGLLGLTHSYASRLIKDGITVNTICPALIITDMVSEDLRAKPALIPVGRFGEVEEVAEAALMLAGNGYITGQTIQVNGGLYMT
ncbi:MAG TPA: 3-oxoacyl-ACP reductase family protein [Thermodesulfobacteriota bacterium]|nr:3-oxoacyl-ACP reductase family protein [Thermodesulfobacteriota bacterium]